MPESTYRLNLTLVPTPGTLILGRNTYSSIFSRAEMTQTRMMLSSGPMVVCSLFAHCTSTESIAGPGGSSAIGLFMELGTRSILSRKFSTQISEAYALAGPCRILDKEGPKFHPESWNSNANIFFIDQPVSVGFSYAEYGESVVRVPCILNY